MFHKPIDRITKADIDALVTNGTAEVKTLDFKQSVPGTTDNDKKELLADVSSFANASGGDLVFGVVENAGVAMSAPGLTLPDVDAEQLRLESLIRDGVAPRIPGIHIKKIDGFRDGSVLVLRVPKSWASPHMVTLKGTSRFYARNSVGKFQLDVSEIRAAFVASESLVERIRQFRIDRLAKIVANEGAVRLEDSPKVVLHLVPVASLYNGQSFGVSELQRLQVHLQPLNGPANSASINIDGYLLTRNRGEAAHAYCQCFRNGAVESVDGTLTNDRGQPGTKTIPCVRLEKQLFAAVDSHLVAYRALGLPTPSLVMLSLLGFRGYSMSYAAELLPTQFPNIDRDVITVPEIIIEDYAVAAKKSMRAAIDIVWNAAGRENSPNYDDQGNWNPVR